MTPADIRAAIAADPALQALVPDTVALAEALSVSRTRLKPTEIGVGMILATLAPNGGTFLDDLNTVGQTDRNVHWVMDLLRQGRFDIGMPASRAMMQQLAGTHPELASGFELLLPLGEEPDPVTEYEVRCAIYNDNGSLAV